MAFLAYIDASGSGLDPNVKAISVGGFVGHESAWLDFERRWSALLAETGVREFHMKEFAHGRGEFEPWKDDAPRRDEFMKAITTVMRECALQPLGASIPLSVYRLFNRQYCVEEVIGTPYTVAAMLAIANAAEWRDRSGIKEPLMFFIERGDNQQADFRRYISRITWGDDGLIEPVILQKRIVLPDGTVQYTLPFQACDFIVWEQAKALTNIMVHRKMQLRQSLRAVLTPIEDLPDGRSYWTLGERTSFATSMETFRVPRRFNHFVGGPSSRRFIVDPLCYLDGQPVVSYIYGTGYINDEDPYSAVGAKSPTSLWPRRRRPQ